MTSREFALYYARQNLERLLVDAIIAMSRIDRLDAAIDRSTDRMKTYARDAVRYVPGAPRLRFIQDKDKDNGPPIAAE